MIKWDASHKNDGDDKISWHDSKDRRFHIHATPNKEFGARGQLITKGRVYHTRDLHSGHETYVGTLADAKAWCETRPPKEGLHWVGPLELLINHHGW